MTRTIFFRAEFLEGFGIVDFRPQLFQHYFWFFCISSVKKVIQEIKNVTFLHHLNTQLKKKNVSFATKNRFYGQSKEIKVVSLEKLKSLTYSKYFSDHRVSQKSKHYFFLIQNIFENYCWDTLNENISFNSFLQKIKAEILILLWKILKQFF